MTEPASQPKINDCIHFDYCKLEQRRQGFCDTNFYCTHYHKPKDCAPARQPQHCDHECFYKREILNQSCAIPRCQHDTRTHTSPPAPAPAPKGMPSPNSVLMEPWLSGYNEGLKMGAKTERKQRRNNR